jgi:hypothetical protein
MLYTYKHNTYKVIRTVKIKNQYNRNWDDGVLYESLVTGEAYAREAKEFFNLFKEKEKIPFHIQAISKVYPVLSTEGNLAKGEIRKFQFVESQRGRTEIGKRVTTMEIINNQDYGAIWVHVGNDYFKMIGIWPEHRR